MMLIRITDDMSNSKATIRQDLGKLRFRMIDDTLAAGRRVTGRIAPSTPPDSLSKTVSVTAQLTV
jgi:hypothetical protein